MKTVKFLTKYKWYRRWIGGGWYKHEVNDVEFWSRKRHLRVVSKLIKIEYYRR
jgi:hypothetical protein